jgi:hypothetical protein
LGFVAQLFVARYAKNFDHETGGYRRVASNLTLESRLIVHQDRVLDSGFDTAIGQV